MEKINYRGWPNSIRLANDLIELVITTDIGPRIIRLAFLGQANEFFEDKEWIGKAGSPDWHNYGGHRLWRAPELVPDTYFADNGPVAVEEIPEGIRFQPPPENSGIQKEMTIRLDPSQARVRIRHRLLNTGSRSILLAPWALSVMAPGGTGVLPLPPRGTHSDNLLPTSSLALWVYTDLSDKRWHLGKKYILLRQDPREPGPQKIGMPGTEGWAAYCRANHLFLKTFSYQPGAQYPDLGSSTELYTNPSFLELETLGPLSKLDPGKSVDHWEEWNLFDSVSLPVGDADVDREVLPRIEQVRKQAA